MLITLSIESLISRQSNQSERFLIAWAGVLPSGRNLD